ncbi:MAG: DUF3597 domain-containing protein [Thermoanaerobaculia bacterium]
MGMFNDLMQKIFHSSARAEAPPDAAAKPGVAPESRVAAAARQGAPAGGSVDVAATLDKMATSNKEKLDWKHSIVDLMKLVGMDSSLSARKALAADLKYSGDTNDSATMNMWLHKEVMKKLAANGGKVPAELLSR